MIKCLYAIGDSWTEGDELGGTSWENVITPMYRYNNSYPKLLADKLGIPVCINDGMRGTSGARMFRRAARFMRQWQDINQSGDELMVVVCWTTLERDELPVDKDGKPCYIPYHYYKYNMPLYSQVSNIDPTIEQAMERMHPLYTVTVGEESRAEMQYERMWNLEQIATTMGVTLIQCFALDNPHFSRQDNKFRKDWYDSVNYLEPEFINFCKTRNIPLAPGGHCLEEGHQQWAEYLYEHVTTHFEL